MLKRTFTLSLFMLISYWGFAQVVINEFLVDANTVELKNLGTEEVDVSGYFLCSFPAYSQIGNLTLFGDDFLLGPGEIIAVAGHPLSADDELGLYTLAQYTNSDAIIDYVEWGSSNHQRAMIAQMAGIWTVGPFLPTPEIGQSYAYDGDGDTIDDWYQANPSFQSENPGDCGNVGGMISTSDPTTICSGDGQEDPINVTLTGNEGANSAWVITDANGSILALPDAPPFDLEPAGEGICLIWHISFEDDFEGLALGNGVPDFEGCYDLSNPITVARNGVSGGMISTMDPTDICAGDGIADPINVMISDTTGQNSAWVITDEMGNILGLPEAPPFDLEGAGEGVCLIWHLSFANGLQGAEVGMNANDLEGCFDLSNPITVTRTGVDGGTISTEDPTEICAGDGVNDSIDVTLEGNLGQNSAWVITDEAGNILGLPAGPPFDLEGAGEGVCLIWHLSFEDGLEGAEVGMNANDLSGCYALSNPISVTRTGVDGGIITTNDPTDVCVGEGQDAIVNATLDEAVGQNSAWVLTDENALILAIQSSGSFDFSGTPSGVCLIWHLSFEDGLEGALEGESANDLVGCFDLSNPITVNRTEVSGGMISTNDPLVICADDGIDNPIDVNLEGDLGANSAWVITDENGEILGLPAAPPFVLEGAGAGVCLIWHLSFEDGLVGAEVGMNANDLEGCFSLSNALAVTRLTGDDCNCVVDGGTIETNDPLSICTGDGVSDPINVSLANATGSNSAWVITDLQGMILGLPEGSPFDLEGAGDGVCLIWHLSFEDGLVGAEVGMNANDLEGCFDLSNPIEVVRTGVIGGVLSTEDNTNICVGDGESDAIDVTLEGNFGSNSAWVITDENGEIVGLPNNPPFELEGAGGGVCLIWHLSFEDGLTGAEVGMNANDLAGCYSLSNPIEVVRTAINGGEVSTTDGETSLTITVGDGIADVIDFQVENNDGANYTYIVTDGDDQILAVLDGNSNDFEDAPEGQCHLWGIAHEGDLSVPEMGSVFDISSDACFDLSNNFVIIDRLTIGVNELTSRSVNIYPNPSNGMVQLDSKNLSDFNSLEVMNMSGQILKSNQINAQQLLRLDLSDLAAGTYFLVLRGDESIEQYPLLLK